MKDSKQLYEEKIKELKIQLRKVENISKIFAIARLSIVFIAAMLLYYFYKDNNIINMTYSLAGAILIFSILAFFHNEKITEKNKLLLMLEYNEKGIKRINGEWKKFKDIGEEFIELEHNFSSDLDIFGKNSLFQWINVTNTKFGRKALAKMLKLNKLPNKYEIEERQKAIKEISNKREFAENLYVNSYIAKKNKDNIEDLLIWAKEKGKISLTVKYVPYIFIANTIIFIFLVIVGRLPFTILLLVFLINYLVVRLLTRNLSEVIHLFVKQKNTIIQYANILNIIESTSFESKNLIELQKKLVDGKISCKSEMKKLKNIINWIGDSQGNAYYLLINVTVLSDIFILKNLEKWRAENGESLEQWLKIMGEFEALASVANLAYEHKQWVYPLITHNKMINAVDVGHPLLGEKAEVNSFVLSNDKKVALITGSNMSGKSTFLRTIGFNMILSYLGLPTFSTEFKCGIFNIYTCMRTQDNLEESISSFYAEIMRIKLVIDGGKKGENIFFLLDEIFKGTNSKDRHDGATILIEQLAKVGAMGLVSTHDLELCELENIKTWLVNFNFQEYYEDNNIRFDYKLRIGKSKTQNAKHLMRLAGIEVS